MATLFEKELNQHDYEFAYANLKYSPLSDTTWETQIITYLFDDQKEIVELLSLAESYAEEIYTYSSAEMYLRYHHISSSLAPSIEAVNIHIDTTGNESCSGLMTGQAAASIMSSYFWREYSSVQITNMLYSSAYETDTHDPMATQELIDTTFLGTSAGQVLRVCTVEPLGLPVRDESVSPLRVVPFSDLQRAYFNQTDTIPLNTYKIHNMDYIFSHESISANSIEFTGRLVLSDAVGDGDFLTLESYTADFLQKGGYISDNAELKDDTTTNAVVLSEAVDTFVESKAPIEGWRSTDLTKSTFKTNEFLDGVVDEILENTTPSNSDEMNSVVAKREIDYMLDKLIAKILDEDVCNDN